MNCIIIRKIHINLDEFYEILGGMWHFNVDESTSYLKCNQS